MPDLVKSLEEANAALALINPLIPMVAGLGRAILAIGRHMGADLGDFDAEMARYDAAVAKLDANDAAWRVAHPEAPVDPGSGD